MYLSPFPCQTAPTKPPENASSTDDSSGADSGFTSVNPTPDPDRPGGIYVPKDLDDAFIELKKMLPANEVEAFASAKEEASYLHHMGLGMWLRGAWGLWGDSRLAKWFHQKGIHHADDMSATILISFWRHLNNKPIRLDEQIEYYEAYWQNMQPQSVEVEEKLQSLDEPSQYPIEPIITPSEFKLPVRDGDK